MEIPIDQDSDTPIFRQIYQGLRDGIQDGRLREKTRLPSSRTLSKMLGVSRTSIVSAFEQLLAEGYIEGKLGSGTFVAPHLDAYIDDAGSRRATPTTVSVEATVSARARRLIETVDPLRQGAGIPFNTGVTSADARSFDALKKIASKHLSQIGLDYRAYSDPLGRPDLRELIARYLRVARSVRCTAENVILTAGAQEAIDLTIKVLVDSGTRVWVEEPGYPLAQAALKTAGAIMFPIPVDHEGLDVSRGVLDCPDARVVYVTPSHQYPLGVMLSISRRIELLQWAHSAGAWIIEDDYDSEFRYDGRPLASLQGLDQDNRVIYIGTFSKVLLPGLRLGYVVVPDTLMPAFAAARFLTDRQPAMLEQLIIRDFISEGHFTSHIRRLRKSYNDARDQLLSLISRDLRPFLEVEAPAQGMHLVARTSGNLSDVALAELAASGNVLLKPVSKMFLNAPRTSALMFGFTGFSAMDMQLGVKRLQALFGKAADLS